MATPWQQTKDAQVASLMQMGRKELRHLQTIEDLVGCITRWPSHMREMMLSTHLRFRERFQLTLFLLGNWLPPLVMVEWYIMRGMLKDRSARDNVADLIRQHMAGELETKGYMVWQMGATRNKPAALREHRWDGVGEDDPDKLRVLLPIPLDVTSPWNTCSWEHAIAQLLLCDS